MTTYLRTHRIVLRIGYLCLVLTWMCVPGCRKKDESGPVRQRMEIIKTQGIEMVCIPAGTFQMGSQAGSADEAPVHRVSVDAFLMDRHEVTQAQYSAFPLPDPSHFKDPNRPVEQINWTDALAFCNERSLDEGLTPCYDLDTGECNFQASGYRLPTEAEWEYACRAGTQTEFSCGNEGHLQACAWYKANASQSTQPVATRQANAWGLYDMHGNVKEWCHDYYKDTFYQESPEKNPRGPVQGRERIIRGGGWDSSAASCRSAYREADASINDTCLASDAIGFRCVRNMPPDMPPDIGSDG
ncbi:MAG: formylglycine-generating enzyme family protein [Phycisphaerae bacterium]|nr:formylglycine-generating enzyme family protein [Phycisphaerae bacterium]